MNIERMVSLVGGLSYFDLQTIAQLSGDSRHNLRIQIHRWTREGKIVSLRRGMYVLGSAYRRIEPNPAMLANQMYSPSYMSYHWALGYHGLIPEKVVLYTSATTRKPCVFENEFGHFRYTHIKQACFFGCRAFEARGQKFLVADPEKALLDFWHSEAGEWTLARMISMRFQNVEAVSVEKLREYAGRFNSPRLVRAAQRWAGYVDREKEGYREL